MGSRWTLVLYWGLSKPSSQESRSGSYGSVKWSPTAIMMLRRERWRVVVVWFFACGVLAFLVDVCILVYEYEN